VEDSARRGGDRIAESVKKVGIAIGKAVEKAEDAIKDATK
jgi:hypothetical protein